MFSCAEDILIMFIHNFINKSNQLRWMSIITITFFKIWNVVILDI